jgi:pSer/pThr/pTyr-binding forkhead associated (FHA) protein
MPAQEDEQLREVKSGISGEPRIAPGLKVTVEETDGYSPGKRYVIIKPVTVIGRSKSEILLDDPEVSRRHAAIEIYGEKVIIKDLGSTNGTFLNGLGIKMAYVEDGDVVQVGNTTLKVRFS